MPERSRSQWPVTIPLPRRERNAFLGKRTRHRPATLQQDASRRLGYSAVKTMVVAQQLYEGVDFGEGPAGPGR